LRLPVALAISMVTWSHIDAYYEHKLENNIHQNVMSHSKEYSHLITSDYRYRQIKQALDSKEISEQVALQRAFWLEMAFSEYFKNRESMGVSHSPELDAEMKLLNHHVFLHLKKVFTDGVTPMKGFVVPESAVGHLSADQKIQLFELTHSLNLKYQMIVEFANDTPLYKKVSGDPEIKKILSTSVNTDFYKKLLELRSAGKISSDQLIYSLQEDAYWQNRFLEWTTLGVTKLKKVNEIYSDQPLTIEDIRLEIVTDLENKSLTR
jgi:hypothetical protein